jgi:hypothetical protein
MANPAPLFTFPTEPITTQPTIIVTSPVLNQTYASTEMLLALTVIKPDTWFAFDAFSHEDHSPGTQTFVNITSVYYVIDDCERQTIPVHDITSLFDTAPTLTLNLSTVLPLATGTHNIKVGLEADSYYVVKYTYNLSDALSSIKLSAESTPVNFKIAARNEPRFDSNSTVIIAPENQPAEPFPTTWLMLTVGVAAVACIGVVVYLKKRNHAAKVTV